MSIWNDLKSEAEKLYEKYDAHQEVLVLVHKVLSAAESGAVGAVGTLETAAGDLIVPLATAVGGAVGGPLGGIISGIITNEGNKLLAATRSKTQGASGNVAKVPPMLPPTIPGSVPPR